MLANDLNPDAFKWLQLNVKKNKLGHLVRCGNKCAREFLLESICAGPDDKVFSHFDHVYMNLPGNAVDFLDVFQGYAAYLGSCTRPTTRSGARTTCL